MQIKEHEKNFIDTRHKLEETPMQDVVYCISTCAQI
jgi:hypothetical protein